MSNENETFFTSVGCMDGRVQEPILKLGKIKFGAKFADTITEAGLVGLLANNPKHYLFDAIKQKLLISLEKHHSKGIIVHGHQECAALSGINDEKHKNAVRKAVIIIQSLVNSSIPVVGVFVKRPQSDTSIWEAEELAPTAFA